MAEFLVHNAAAVLALFGVLLGGILTGLWSFASGWIMRNRDLDLKIWEKLLDRRLAAHEAVIKLAKVLRRMVPLGRLDASREVVRAPAVMMSKEAFENWLSEFAEKSSFATTWLATPVKRELNFAQDYFVTIHTNLSGCNSQDYATVGAFVRQDFIDLSSQLEKMTYEVFLKEARKRRLADLSEWHKYPSSETRSRLQQTVLLSKWREIKASFTCGD